MTVVNRLLMAAIGLAVAAAGVVVVAEVALAVQSAPGWLIDRPSLRQTLQGLRWSDPVALATGAGALAIGLLLLAAELKPRRRDAYPAASDRDDRHVTYDRHGLEQLAEQVARDHADVATADATLRRRVLRLRADAYADGDVGATRRDVAEQVRDRIAQLRLDRAPRVAVRSARTGRRVR